MSQGGLYTTFSWLIGPHYYTAESRIGSLSNGITAESVFQDGLRYFPSPSFWPQQRSDGSWSIAIPAGPVTHTVDPDGLTIINTTLPGHLLYPGTVFREVVQRVGRISEA